MRSNLNIGKTQAEKLKNRVDVNHGNKHSTMTNVEILAEILKSAENIPFSGKSEVVISRKGSNRPLTSSASNKILKQASLPIHTEFIGIVVVNNLHR